MLDFRTLWEQALPFDAYVAAGSQHRGLWEGLYRIARLPEWALGALPAGHSAGCWCWRRTGAAMRRTLCRSWPAWPMRCRGWSSGCCVRDEHPEVMDRYLTNGSRSIPIVIALNEEFGEVGHWGPRPTELQSWVLTNRQTIPKSELYPQVRRWYARDRGESTLREVLAAAGYPAAKVA